MACTECLELFRYFQKLPDGSASSQNGFFLQTSASLKRCDPFCCWRHQRRQTLGIFLLADGISIVFFGVLHFLLRCVPNSKHDWNVDLM